MNNLNSIAFLILIILLLNGCSLIFIGRVKKLENIENPQDPSCKLRLYAYPGNATTFSSISFKNCHSELLGVFSTGFHYKSLKEYYWVDNETLELILKSDAGRMDSFKFRILTDSVVYLYSNVNMPD